MCYVCLKFATLSDKFFHTLENLTSITTMKAIAMMLLRKSENGKQNINSNLNTATKIKGVKGVDKNKDKDVQNENEEENENENEKENETAIEMLLKGENRN